MSSSSSSSSSSDESSSSSSSLAKKSSCSFKVSKGQRKILQKWQISAIDSDEAKLARERYVPTFKSKDSPLTVPEIDNSFYETLKESKKSQASKANIEPEEKPWRQLHFKIADLVSRYCISPVKQLPVTVHDGLCVKRTLLLSYRLTLNEQENHLLSKKNTM